MKCIKCGHELTENDKFCTECGTSIDDNPTQVLTPIVEVQPLEGGDATPINEVATPEASVSEPVAPVETPVTPVTPVQPAAPVAPQPVAQPSVAPVAPQQPKKNNSSLAFTILAVVLIAVIGVLVYFITQKNDEKKEEVTPTTTTTTKVVETTTAAPIVQNINTITYYGFEIAIPDSLEAVYDTENNLISMTNNRTMCIDVSLLKESAYEALDENYFAEELGTISYELQETVFGEKAYPTKTVEFSYNGCNYFDYFIKLDGMTLSIVTIRKDSVSLETMSGMALYILENSDLGQSDTFSATTLGDYIGSSLLSSPNFQSE